MESILQGDEEAYPNRKSAFRQTINTAARHVIPSGRVWETSMMAAISIIKHTLMITSFVVVMMLVIEYLNVLSRGSWQNRLAGQTWGQYFLAAILGATPGCLGAFAVVAMYSHGVLSLGAVVAAMVATSGDESFVMLALIPQQAILLFVVLIPFGVGIGALTDLAARKFNIREPRCEELTIHDEASCECFPGERILQQWKECSAPRGILTALLVVIVAGVFGGELGPAEWNWIRVTLLLVSAGAIFIVTTVPDHFLDQHLWEHVVRKHAPRVFLWTLGALAAMHLLTEVLPMENAIREGKWIVLLVACLVGMIPESGPHLIFVTLYAQGTIPFSVLLASSIVQDGHGMLPLLAESREAFGIIKAINFVGGFLIGAAAMKAGF